MEILKMKKLFKRLASFAMAVAMTLSVSVTAKAAAAGIDVSKYQGAINWSAVAASGVSFTYI